MTFNSGLFKAHFKYKLRVSNFGGIEVPVDSWFYLAFTGFPAGVENMGGCTPRGSSKFDEGRGLESIHGGAWGLKLLLKNTREGAHLSVRLPAISMQGGKFTKNQLLHTYFSRILAILARFYSVRLNGWWFVIHDGVLNCHDRILEPFHEPFMLSWAFSL